MAQEEPRKRRAVQMLCDNCYYVRREGASGIMHCKLYDFETYPQTRCTSWLAAWKTPAEEGAESGGDTPE